MRMRMRTWLDNYILTNDLEFCINGGGATFLEFV
jgi:hypothetical protein